MSIPYNEGASSVNPLKIFRDSRSSQNFISSNDSGSAAADREPGGAKPE